MHMVEEDFLHASVHGQFINVIYIACRRGVVALNITKGLDWIGLGWVPQIRDDLFPNGLLFT